MYTDQARLAERLLDVIRRMGFSNISHSATGGYVDIEGFNGPVGYRVVLPPHGQAEVNRDGVDVSADYRDPVAAEALSPQRLAREAVKQQHQRISDSLARSAGRRSARRPQRPLSH